MRAPSGGLVSAPPKRPGDDVGRLDAPLRKRLRRELAEMLERVQVPTLLVTHDPQDVEALAQDVIRIDDGRIVDGDLGN